MDPAIRLGTTRAIEALADAGWDVEEACPDLMGADDCFEDLRALFQTFHMAALVDDERVKATARYEIRLGLSLDADRIAEAVATEGRIRSIWDQFFVEGRFDALLSPTTQVPPFPIDMEWFV